MTQEPVPTPPENDPESWDEMAARVATEEINTRYAQSLANSLKAYMGVGFSYEQAWQLTRDEHRSRLDYMGQAAIIDSERGDDSP